MNLLQSLQNTQTQRATQPVPGQSADLRKLLAAKSGKAGATSGPAASAVQEKQALADFGTQATQQQQAGQIDVAAQQAAQAAQQQQQAQAQTRLARQRQDMNQQYNQAITKIANDLDRLSKDIDSKQGRAALADAITARRLSDRAYMAELERQGNTRRLANEQDYAIEAAHSAFGNWEELFRDKSEFDSIMRATDAEFEKDLARMGEAAADAILAAEMGGANRQSQYSAIGDMTGTLIQAGATEYEDDKGRKASFFERMGDD